MFSQYSVGGKPVKRLCSGGARKVSAAYGCAPPHHLTPRPPSREGFGLEVQEGPREPTTRNTTGSSVLRGIEGKDLESIGRRARHPAKGHENDGGSKAWDAPWKYGNGTSTRTAVLACEFTGSVTPESEIFNLRVARCVSGRRLFQCGHRMQTDSQWCFHGVSLPLSNRKNSPSLLRPSEFPVRAYRSIHPASLIPTMRETPKDLLEGRLCSQSYSVAPGWSLLHQTRWLGTRPVTRGRTKTGSLRYYGLSGPDTW
jgi:hypothetical protein